MIEKLYNKVQSGNNISQTEALQLADYDNKEALYEAANNIRKAMSGNYMELCSIVNAKSGKCPENCKFCAQSAHFNIDIDEYDMVDSHKALQIAKENESSGVHKLSLVTSGKKTSLKNIERLGGIYKQIKQETNIELCASMGLLTEEKAKKLLEFGIKNYHCNLETGRSFFPKICTTHTFDEKIETIKIAQKAGLNICSGGIIGLGETMEHRIEMAIELRELGIKSIPINILSPIKGTPLEKNSPLTEVEILTTIAVFRFINPTAYIRFAGGRSMLGKAENKALNAGINAALVGNYLTTNGKNIDEDLENFSKQGFMFRK